MLESQAEQVIRVNDAQDKSPQLQLAKQAKEQVVAIKAGFTQYEVINAIYDSKILSSVKLTAGARLVLISLARHYNPANDEFFPSYACIASHTGVSKKSVERAIKELVGAGLITYRTEKVNRYRFTGRFFASVNLSVAQRQNDGCDLRQNDEQTNNHEKIINNKNILNFSLKCEASQKLETSEGQASQYSVINENLYQNLTQKARSKFAAGAGQNDAKEPIDADLRQNDGVDRLELVLEPNNAVKECAQRAAATAFQQVDPVKKQYWQPMFNSSQVKTPTGGRYNVPPADRKGGSSFTPSISTTNEYLQAVRQARSEACSPLEFDYETAKRWYSTLSAPLRQTSLARKVATKFGL